MEHFAGLDVSVKGTSVCIVDDTGKIIREVKVASEPEALSAVLKSPAYHFKRIGLEAGPLSQWLLSALAEAGLPAICVETRHMQAVLKAQINKTDRNDARGIAQMMEAIRTPYSQFFPLCAALPPGHSRLSILTRSAVRSNCHPTDTQFDVVSPFGRWLLNFVWNWRCTFPA